MMFPRDSKSLISQLTSLHDFWYFLPLRQICSVPKALVLIRENCAVRLQAGLSWEKLRVLTVSIALLSFGHRDAL